MKTVWLCPVQYQFHFPRSSMRSRPGHNKRSPACLSIAVTVHLQVAGRGGRRSGRARRRWSPANTKETFPQVWTNLQDQGVDDPLLATGVLAVCGESMLSWGTEVQKYPDAPDAVRANFIQLCIFFSRNMLHNFAIFWFLLHILAIFCTYLLGFCTFLLFF